MGDMDEIPEALHFRSFGSSSASDFGSEHGSEQVAKPTVKLVFEAVKEGRDEQKEKTDKVLTAITDAVAVVGRDKAAPQIAEILKTLKEGQEEQRQHDKSLRAIWHAILVVGFGLGVLMFVCTVMLYMKPCACAPVVNHTCAPVLNCTTCAPPVHRMKRAPPKRTTCAPVVKYTKCAPPVYRTKRAPPVYRIKRAPCAQPVNQTTVKMVVYVHVNGMNSTSFMDTPKNQCAIDDKEMWDFPENKCSIDNKHNMTNAQQNMIIGAVIAGPSLAATIGATVAMALGY